MKFMLGIKGRMTQVFDKDGRVWPATIVNAAPITITQMKTEEKDGYFAVQVGAGKRSEKNIAKPQRGHFKGLGSFAVVREFRLPSGENKEGKRGDILDISAFEEGDKVSVSAVSKGKGFQGVVKRHGFAGGPRTHGNKHSERSPGSIGVGGVQRVMKGKRMAGRMGGDRITVKNLKVLQVNEDSNAILISGAIPGRPGTVVEIRG